MFSGSIVALVTPFTESNTVDFDKIGELIEFHLQNGTSGIVPCGTTGESPTLSHAEHHQVIEQVVKFVNGRVPVIAGAGSNSTTEAVQLSQHAEKAGADGILSVTPYYNKPTQNGMLHHFRAVADAVSIPIVLYNIPGRSAAGLDIDSIEQLAAHPNIQYVKEATGSVNFASEILSRTDLTVLSGDDPLTLPIMAIGGKGVITVSGNLLPQWMADLVRTAAEGDFEAARGIHYRLVPVFQALFTEVNPLGIKAAMEMKGLCHSRMRLPMTPMQDHNLQTLRSVLTDSGLL